MAQQPFFGNDPFVDSEDLMSWLLLNPEIDALTGNYGFPLFDNSLNNPEFDQKIAQGYSSSLNPESFTMNGTYPVNDGSGYPQMLQNPSSDGVVLPPSINTKVKKEGKREASPNADSSYRRVSKIQRKRPRESLDDLENRVKELKAENADLHAHLLNVTQRTTEVQKQRVSMERLMATKLGEIDDRKDADQAELAEIVKQYTDLYADYGKCRQREVSFEDSCLFNLMRISFSLGCISSSAIGKVDCPDPNYENVPLDFTSREISL